MIMAMTKTVFRSRSRSRLLISVLPFGLTGMSDILSLSGVRPLFRSFALGDMYHSELGGEVHPRRAVYSTRQGDSSPLRQAKFPRYFASSSWHDPIAQMHNGTL